MTKEAMPPDVLEHEVRGQEGGEADAQRRPAGGGQGCNEANRTRADVAKDDPGTGPEQGARPGIDEESVESEGDRPGESGGERVQTRQKLGQDQILSTMGEESLLGVPDERVRIQREAAQGTEHSKSQRTTQHIPEDVGTQGGDHRGANG